jgi:hypothetical protein
VSSCSHDNAAPEDAGDHTWQRKQCVPHWEVNAAGAVALETCDSNSGFDDEHEHGEGHGEDEHTLGNDAGVVAHVVDRQQTRAVADCYGIVVPQDVRLVVSVFLWYHLDHLDRRCRCRRCSGSGSQEAIVEAAPVTATLQVD